MSNKLLFRKRVNMLTATSDTSSNVILSTTWVEHMKYTSSTAGHQQLRGISCKQTSQRSRQLTSGCQQHQHLRQGSVQQAAHV